MRSFTHLEIISTFKRKGYKINEAIGEVNIFGIRNSDNNSNTFDDSVGILYRVTANSWVSLQYNATTDPGKYYLENPINKDGTAVIVPGQYLKVYKVGKHTDYEAMEQIADITYVRDNDKNSVINLLYKVTGFKAFKQIGKTNIHHAGVDSKQVDKWSAGCQVVAKLSEFVNFMNIVKASNTYKTTNEFDYTLFEIEDLIKQPIVV